MDRVKTNELEITVTRNLVTGDCCVNELNIETILKFCTDLTCDTYIDSDPIPAYERKEDIFVEHSIVSPEF